MDNWERLILYRKKLVLPRIYQVVDWFSWLACFAAVLFIASIVYRYGFTVFRTSCCLKLRLDCFSGQYSIKSSVFKRRRQ